ncbi:NAD(P)-binding protein [Lipomyces arxii]|uniref:NAD(P)-binding protein n=1 Tax=Lipomyces arxii TaxID=56418 RepID=UPI0034CFCCF6
MKVLVLGATGFIGKPVAQEFAGQGYDVYGQTRKDSATAELQKSEIRPIVGNPAQVVKEVGVSMDVIIDCLGAHGGSVSTGVFEEVLAAARTRGPAYKLAFIFTSGTWTHGEPTIRTEFTSERAPLGIAPELVQWRAIFEKRIITSVNEEVSAGGSCLMPIIIRPAMLYGRKMSIFSDMFEQAFSKEEIVWPGKAGVTRYNTIHQDDLARLYVLVAERAPVFNCLCLDASNPMTEGVEDILAALCAAAGENKTFRLRESENIFELAMGTTAKNRPSLGYALAGWTPRKPGLIDGMPNYYSTWKAYKK